MLYYHCAKEAVMGLVGEGSFSLIPRLVPLVVDTVLGVCECFVFLRALVFLFVLCCLAYRSICPPRISVLGFLIWRWKLQEEETAYPKHVWSPG